MIDETTQDPEANGEVNEMVEWLKDHVIEIKTVKPQEDQQDLNLLKNVIGTSQVVGLGEATIVEPFFTMPDNSKEGKP